MDIENDSVTTKESIISWDDFDIDGLSFLQQLLKLDKIRRTLGVACNYRVGRKSRKNRKFSVGSGSRQQIFDYSDIGIKLFSEYLRLEWSERQAINHAENGSRQNEVTETYEKSENFKQRLSYLGWRFGYLECNDTIFGLVSVDFHDHHSEVNVVVRDRTFENLFEIIKLVVDAESRHAELPPYANYSKAYFRAVNHFAQILK